MDNKITSSLEKALQDKRKGNYERALGRITEILPKFPAEAELYIEAADVCIEGGEPLQGAQYLKDAYVRCGKEKGRIDAYALEKLRSTGDSILIKCLLDSAVKRRDLDNAAEILEDLPDRSIRELLHRTRTKQQTLNSAARGGHTLRKELVTNQLSEGVLCLRLGRMKEAVRAFVDVLDDRPAENEALEPFLGELAKKYNNAGRVQYAHACSLITAQQFEKAMIRLIEGVKMEPGLAEEALERLQELSDRFENPPDSLQDALIELLLVSEEITKACEILRESLEQNPDNARKILELVRPYTARKTGNMLLQYLYMDAALVADLPGRMLDSLNRLCEDDATAGEVYRWLETKSSDSFLPAEIMLFQGRLALEQGEYSRGVEVLRAVTASAPINAPAVLRIANKHRESARAVAEFYDELAREQQSAQTDSGEGIEFEHFENSDFGLSEENDAVPDDSPAEPDPAVPHVAEEEEEEEDPPREQQPVQAPKTAGADCAIVWEEEDANGEIEPSDDPGPAGTDDNSWLETGFASAFEPATPSLDTEPPGKPAQPDVPPEPGKKVIVEQPEETAEPEPAAEAEPATEPEPAAETEPEKAPVYETDARQVEMLAESLREAGARLFFHIEDDQPETEEPDERKADAEQPEDVRPDEELEIPPAEADGHELDPSRPELMMTYDEEGDVALVLEKTTSIHDD
jgi:hypothetical protein